MDNHSPLEAIFFAALKKAVPEERAAYLDEACTGDPDLRRRVEKMLSAQAEAGSFLEQPADGPAMTVDQKPADEGPGMVIGPYKLLQQIGEGGMGTVFMAEQSRPVQRKVALKLIKAGMDSRQVIARFEAERQALALMDHPNIASVLDAGTTEAGRPYFVMELVKGVPITSYCDEHHLTPKERLELFMPVCQAVQHAHQKGIIHRDLKPSNVMVCLYDGKAVPKVIDFGVAKATGQKLTERTMFTEIGSVVGTLEYMSPEQAELNQLDVDTRSDIYSLGVLLYELLTGTTPLERKRMKQVAILELLRLVREEEAPKPSTRLSTAEALPSIAANRGTEPKKLSGLMRGELDWIVLKALEKDRNRRYETANGLARDVERHLRDEAVLACPPSAGYRLRKFARRNRVGLAAATGVAVALLAGLAVSTWQAVRATRAEGLAAERLAAEVAAGERAKADEARAVSETRRATAVADLLQQMLASANPEVAQKAGMTVRELLEAFSAGLGDQLKDQPEVEATVRQVIGRAYWRLNLNAEAAPHLERAVALRRATPGTDPRLLAESLAAWGRVVYELRRYDRARPVLEEALALQRQAGVPAHQVIETMVSLQMLALSGKRGAASDRLVAEARELARALPGGDNPALACMLHVQARYRQVSNRPAEAEALAREAVGMHRRTRTPNDVELAHGLTEWADCLNALKRYDEAEPPAKEALAIFRAHFPDDNKFVTHTLDALVAILRGRGKAAEADEIVTDHARRLLAGHGLDLKGWLSWAEALQALKQWEPALQGYREAARLAGPDDRSARARIGKGMRSVAGWLRLEGDRKETVLAHQEAAALLDQVLAEDPTGAGAAAVKEDLASVFSYLGWTLSELNRHPEAIEAYRKALALWPELRAADPNREWFHHEHAYFTTLLADSLRMAGRLDEAETAGREGVRLHQDLLARSPANRGYQSRLAWCQVLLGHVYRARGRRPEAELAYREAAALFEKAADKDPFLRVAYECLAEMHKQDGRIPDAVEAQRKAVAASEKWVADGSDPGRRWHVGIACETLGKLYQDVGRIPEALEVQRKAVAVWETLAAKTNDRDLRWHLAVGNELLGGLLKQVGSVQEAEVACRKSTAVWEQLVRERPDSEDYRFHLYWNYQAVIALLPHARAAEAAELALKAEAAIRECVRLKPDSPEAHWYLGNALLKHGKYADAEAAFRDAIRLKPDYPDAHSKLGMALQNQGKFAEAVAEYAETIRLDPDHSPLSHNNLAWLLATCPDAKVRDPKRAVEVAKKAVEQAPGDGSHWNTLGVAQYCAGDWKAATADLEKSMELGKGGDATDWFFLAMARWQLGDKDDARKWYDRAVAWIEKNDPKDEELNGFRAEAERLLGLKK